MKNLNFAAIHHVPYDEYCHTNSSGEVVLLLRTAKANWDSVTAITFLNYPLQNNNADERRYAMQQVACDELYSYYRVQFMPQDPRLQYVFALQSEDFTFYYTYDGMQSKESYDGAEEKPFFHLPYAHKAQSKPAWARGSIAYQIFPDRFARYGKIEPGMEKWESKEVAFDRIFGGNIKGMITKVPYLKRLGAKIVYLTPIFKANTAHRYDTCDYYAIDEVLGTEEDLKNLVDELHKNDMYLVLDGVFNHSGLGFAPFAEAKEKGEESPFYDWFFWNAKESCVAGYASFAYEEHMPKLNLQNPACAEFFCEVGKYWVQKCGIDGWRLDVAPEVYPGFWRKFRSEVQSVRQDLLLVAEIWHDARFFCARGDMFDATMNYVWSKAVWGLFANKNLSITKFANQISKNYVCLPQEVQEVNWNILGSHDTPRFITRAGESVPSLCAAAFFQLTSPGIPIIYYGDEIGMQGGQDPYCRFPMRWDKVQDNSILRYYKQLTHLRNKYEALQYGDFQTFLADDEQGIYAYTRSYGNDTMLCIICAKEAGITKVTIAIPSYISKRIFLRDEVSGERFNCASSVLVLPFQYGRSYCFPISKTLDQLAKEQK